MYITTGLMLLLSTTLTLLFSKESINSLLGGWPTKIDFIKEYPYIYGISFTTIFFFVALWHGLTKAYAKGVILRYAISEILFFVPFYLNKNIPRSREDSFDPSG